VTARGVTRTERAGRGSRRDALGLAAVLLGVVAFAVLVNSPGLWETALREAHEEIGVEPEAVRCLGALTVLEVPVSNNLVQPYIGYTATRPVFHLQDDEVAGLVELPLSVLLDDEARSVEEWELPGRRARVPFYRYQDAVIWGATAMILSELEALLRTVAT